MKLCATLAYGGPMEVQNALYFASILQQWNTHKINRWINVFTDSQGIGIKMKSLQIVAILLGTVSN